MVKEASKERKDKIASPRTTMGKSNWEGKYPERGPK